jgi:hypothetical protein
MKNQKQLFWEELRARATQSEKEIAEIRQLMKAEMLQFEKERQQRNEEREREKQEKEKEKQEKEKERIKREEQQEKERLKRVEADENFMRKINHLNELFAQTREQIGGITRSNGEFCEEYFINSYKENPIFLGEKFDRVIDHLKPDPVVIDDEYDLVLRNGSTIVLIEMKYKASTHDVGKMFAKLHSYRANYPMFNDYKIYLCLASFRFPNRVRAKAAEEGIVLIKQRGEKIEVISKNLKTW